MAKVTFKPVCECGHIFKKFRYIPTRCAESVDREQELIRIGSYTDYFNGLCCPKCGDPITDFTIPVFTRDGKIVYTEE